MIKGEFKRRYILSISLGVSAAIMVVCPFAYKVAGMNVSNTTIPYCLLLSAVLAALAIVIAFFRRKEFIHIDGNHISARYKLFRTLECDISDVKYALSSINLILHLKDGRRVVIEEVINCAKLREAIIKGLVLEEERSVEELIEEIQRNEKESKKAAIVGITSIAVAFVLMIIYFVLHNDIESVGQKLKLLLWELLVLIIEIIFLLIGFGSMRVCFGKQQENMYLRYAIRRKVMESAVLPLGCIRKVFINIYYSVRAVVLGFPNDSGIYVIKQKFNRKFELKTVDTSNIIYDEEGVLAEYKDFMDVTDEKLNNEQ